MNKSLILKTLPLGLLLMSGCAATAPGSHESGGASVTSSTTGYVDMTQGRYAAAAVYFKATDAATPNSPYDELDLAASYQNSGRMDLAEPLYRQAMTHGHNLIAGTTTLPWAKGMTVEDIACRDLALGLKPVSIIGTATPCQTTLVIAILSPSAHALPIVSYNTYFEFDKSSLTPEGRAVVDAAAVDALAHPAQKVYLVGKASRVGPDSYNMTLSEQRADTVRLAMIEDGLPSASINVQWVGERELPVAEADGARQPMNQVVETQIRK